MNPRKWGLTALALVVCATAGTVASANQPLERSGNVFHKAACERGNPHGTARCYAHVVTDARGEETDGQASPNVVPSGFGPSDLRSAYNITASGTSTIAIVDAYGYPNAESDLATYR
ncbi:MAG: hypothetical protein ABIW83_02365, partial [Allosphingosinicella sp.]